MATLRFTLRQLEYFVAVGELGSIAMASERVNVSSPSISSAITQIEQEFGVPLFVRKHAQGLSLTQAGRQFFRQANLVLAEAKKLNELACDISGIVQGELQLGCMLTFAQLVLPDLRANFEQRYPDVTIIQHEMDQMEIANALRDARIDVALTYDLEIPTDLQFIALAEFPPYVLLCESHALASKHTLSLNHLRDCPMVLLDLPISSRYFLTMLEGAGITPTIRERTRDMAVMRSLVANGFGFSIANIKPFHQNAPDGKPLRYIPLDGKLKPMRLGLCLPLGAEKVLAVRAFIEHCQQIFDADYCSRLTVMSAE